MIERNLNYFPRPKEKKNKNYQEKFGILVEYL